MNDSDFDTEEKCLIFLNNERYGFGLIPNKYKSDAVIIRALQLDPTALKHIPEHRLTQTICEIAVSIYPRRLIAIP